jgi:UDP-N-acetylglucosamine--dolichyl-phosphate N-acetylglucosaminephosphotransferase
MLLYYIAIAVVSFLATLVLSHFLIPRLKRFGMTGKDVNKPDKPEVAEMGGIAIVAGFSGGLLLAIFFNTFMGFQFDLIRVLAALLTIHSVAFIGVVDDLIDIPQKFKAFLPLFAAIPLVAVKAAGSTVMTIPLLGAVNFGILYILLLIPLGVAVASNLTNMLAGFNGLEAGMGVVMFGAMTILSVAHGSTEMALISITMMAALAAFMFYNKNPSSVFPGDVGNLTIGAALAASVIIGNFETAGAILVIPYVVDFFIKAYNKFPSSQWWGEYRDGKLYPVGGKVRGFCQLVMKKANGITEQNLVLFFIGLEALFALVVLAVYLRF